MSVFYCYGCLFLSTNSACTDKISLESDTKLLLPVPIRHRMQLKKNRFPEYSVNVLFHHPSVRWLHSPFQPGFSRICPARNKSYFCTMSTCCYVNTTHFLKPEVYEARFFFDLSVVSVCRKWYIRVYNPEIDYFN